MIRINLLPREEMATRRSISIPQISSFAPLALIVVATIGLTVVHMYQGQKISNLEKIMLDDPSGRLCVWCHTDKVRIR